MEALLSCANSGKIRTLAIGQEQTKFRRPFVANKAGLWCGRQGTMYFGALGAISLKACLV